MSIENHESCIQKLPQSLDDLPLTVGLLKRIVKIPAGVDPTKEISFYEAQELIRFLEEYCTILAQRIVGVSIVHSMFYKVVSSSCERGGETREVEQKLEKFTKIYKRLLERGKIFREKTRKTYQSCEEARTLEKEIRLGEAKKSWLLDGEILKLKAETAQLSLEEASSFLENFYEPYFELIATVEGEELKVFSVLREVIKVQRGAKITRAEQKEREAWLVKLQSALSITSCGVLYGDFIPTREGRDLLKMNIRKWVEFLLGDYADMGERTGAVLKDTRAETAILLEEMESYMQSQKSVDDFNKWSRSRGKKTRGQGT